MPRLVSLTDVAKATGINRATLIDWAQAGKIPAVRVPGGSGTGYVWRYDSSRLGEIPEAQERPARAKRLPEPRVTHPEWSGLADLINAAVAEKLIPAEWDYDDLAGLLDWLGSGADRRETAALSA